MFRSLLTQKLRKGFSSREKRKGRVVKPLFPSLRLYLSSFTQLRPRFAVPSPTIFHLQIILVDFRHARHIVSTDNFWSQGRNIGYAPDTHFRSAFHQMLCLWIATGFLTGHFKRLRNFNVGPNVSRHSPRLFSKQMFFPWVLVDLTYINETCPNFRCNFSLLSYLHNNQIFCSNFNRSDLINFQTHKNVVFFLFFTMFLCSTIILLETFS